MDGSTGSGARPGDREVAVDSNYRQEPMQDGRVRFTVTPADVPKASGGPATLAVIFALMVLGTGGRDSSGFEWILRWAIAIGGGWQLFRFINGWFARNVDKIRSPGGSFVVSPQGLEMAGGAVITREQLHRLILRNGVPEIGDVVVVDTGSVYSGMQAGAARDRMANRARAGAVSYMLCAEHGGRSVTLAGGMTEVTAHGLLTDVNRVMNAA
jgi:hypothetical protein